MGKSIFLFCFSEIFCFSPVPGIYSCLEVEKQISAKPQPKKLLGIHEKQVNLQGNGKRFQLFVQRSEEIKHQIHMKHSDTAKCKAPLYPVYE